ncbi:MAG: c-type cytochrome, partial [Methylococcales bacterium]|nr:c-type cytochrome [Methylococcales bacterium]
MTQIKKMILILGFAVVMMTLAACTDNPNPLPTGATPIPTLMPATLPPDEAVEVENLVSATAEFPIELASAENGHLLYTDHCESCHAIDGAGAVPNARDFTNVDYRRGETPLQYYLNLTEGHSGDVDTPAFGDILTSDERWDVVYYVWRFAVPNESLVAGQAIYSENCMECHGASGQSQILGAADFSDQRFISGHPASQLYASITQGKGSMPAWQARLSQDERWAVIDYVRTFTYNPILAVPETESGEEAVVFTQTEVVEPEKPDCAPEYLDQTNPFEWGDEAVIAAGALVYDEFCQRCHGDDGRGVGDLAY